MRLEGHYPKITEKNTEMPSTPTQTRKRGIFFFEKAQNCYFGVIWGFFYTIFLFQVWLGVEGISAFFW